MGTNNIYRNEGLIVMRCEKCSLLLKLGENICANCNHTNKQIVKETVIEPENNEEKEIAKAVEIKTPEEKVQKAWEDTIGLIITVIVFIILVFNWPIIFSAVIMIPVIGIMLSVISILIVPFGMIILALAIPLISVVNIAYVPKNFKTLEKKYVNKSILVILINAISIITSLYVLYIIVFG